MNGMHKRAAALVCSLALVGVSGCGESEPTSESQSAAHTSQNAQAEHPPAPTPWSNPEVLAQSATPQAAADELQSRLAAYNVRQDVIDNAERDGWTTETLSDAAQKRLYDLLHAMQNDELDAAAVEQWVASDFACNALRPSDLSRVYDSDNLVVDRASEPSPETRYRGVAGCRQALGELLPSGRGGKGLKMKVKTWGVDLQGTAMTTRHYVNLHDARGFEQNSEWELAWKVDRQSGKLVLTGIANKDFEEVLAEVPSGHLFDDCTRAVLGDTRNFDEQILAPIHKWLRTIDISVDPDFEGMQGIAIADVDGDGLEDLYACQGGGLPNRLYLQNPDGTLRDATASSGADWIETTRSALLSDLDNDGDPDLVLGTDGMLVVQENDGKGHFTEKARFPDITLAFSLAIADFDVDGDLDIYATRHFSESHRAVGQLPNPVPYHDANNGGRNSLLRNDGDWKFADVTDAVGLDDNNHRWSYAAAWEDYDQDGDLDLYVANDFGRNNLYRNDGGHFSDVAAEAGVEDIASGMAVSWGDYDGDGWSDLYVSNMFSAAGSRITYQRQFQGDASPETLKHYQRLARGNSLFRNLGNGTFEDVSVEAGVTMGRWAWGSGFADINNDGREDIVVANGYVTGEDTGDL